jgi:hypothetical protein
MNALKAAVSGRIPGDIHVSSSSSRAAVRFFKTSFQFHLKSRHLFYWILLPTFSSFCLFFSPFTFSLFFISTFVISFFFYDQEKKRGKHETKRYFFKCSTNTPVVRSGHNNSSAPGD